MKKTLIIVLVVAIVAAVGFFLLKKDSKPVQTNDFSSVPVSDQLLNNMQQAGLPPLAAEGTKMHIHQHLDITINGQDKTVPAEIGEGTSFISPLHTHDSSGVLHVESPEVKDFKLGQFFTEWGIKLDQNCIGSYCSDEKNKLVVAVNGQAITDPANYVLKDHDQIHIWYGPKDQTPEIKATYQFAQGL